MSQATLERPTRTTQAPAAAKKPAIPIAVLHSAGAKQPAPKTDDQKLHDIAGVRLAADVIQQGEKLQGSDGSFFMRKYRPAGNQLNNYALNAIKLVIAHPEIAEGFAAVLSAYLADESFPNVQAQYIDTSHAEIFGEGTWTGADDEPAKIPLEGIEEPNPFLGPEGRDLARNCSYEIEQLMKILIEKTDRDENGPLIRALAARTHTVNSVIIGYLGEDEGESLEDRHWDVYRTAMVTE